MTEDLVPLLVYVPRALRIRVRVAAASSDLTITRVVIDALQARVGVEKESSDADT